MSAADTTFEELWSGAEKRPAERKPRQEQAPNNVGVGLLFLALAIVIAAMVFFGASALGQIRHMSGCANVASQQEHASSCR